MSEITVNIDDYITEEEKRQIAKSAFHAVCVQKSQEDFERILSNAGYQMVEEEVNAAFDGDMRKVVKEKAIEVISKMSTLTVFSPPNAWDRKATKAWEYMNEYVTESRGLIAERVEQIISEISTEDLRDLLERSLLDSVVSRLKGE